MASARDQAHDRARPNVQQEPEHLAEGQRRVAEQIAIIRHMTERGQDKTQAKRPLRNFEELLEIWRAHRQFILDTIAQG